MIEKQPERNDRDNLPKITFVYGEDRQGLYLDGKLFFERGRMLPSEVLKALGIRFEEIYCDINWLSTQENMPQDLEDVNRAKFGTVNNQDMTD